MGYEEAMSDAYIEDHDGVYVVAGDSGTLDSIVYAFLSGQSAEAIVQAFPVLNLEQVYGARSERMGRSNCVPADLKSTKDSCGVPSSNFRLGRRSRFEWSANLGATAAMI
jgi:hypothetical protein